MPTVRPPVASSSPMTTSSGRDVPAQPPPPPGAAQPTASHVASTTALSSHGGAVITTTEAGGRSVYDILPPVIHPTVQQVPISPFRQQLSQHEHMLAAMPESAWLGQAVEQMEDRVSILQVATAMLEQRMRQAPAQPLSPQEVVSLLATVLQLPPDAVPEWHPDPRLANLHTQGSSHVFASPGTMGSGDLQPGFMRRNASVAAGQLLALRLDSGQARKVEGGPPATADTPMDAPPTHTPPTASTPMGDPPPPRPVRTGATPATTPATTPAAPPPTEEQGGNEGPSDSPPKTASRTPSSGPRTSDMSGSLRGSRRRGVQSLKVPPNWQQVPGVCNPFESVGRASKSRRLQHIELLLSVGTLATGQTVVYKNRAGRLLAEGHISDGGIECHRCGRIMGATEFELCAGSSLRRPFEHIFTDYGDSLQDLFAAAQQRQQQQQHQQATAQGTLTRSASERRAVLTADPALASALQQYAPPLREGGVMGHTRSMPESHLLTLGQTPQPQPSLSAHDAHLLLAAMQRQQRPDVQSFLSFLQQQQSAPPPPLGQCSGGMLPIPDTVTGVATEAHLLQQLREQLQGHLQPTVPPLQHTSSAEHLWGPHLAQQQAVQAHAVQQSQQHAAQVQQQQQHQQQNDAALSALHDMLQQQQQSQALFQLGGQLLTVMQYQQQQQQGAGAAVVGGQGVAGGTNVGGTGGAGGGGKTGGMGPLSGMVVPSGVFAGIGGGQDDAAHQSLVNLMSNLQQQQQQQLSGEEVGRESVQLQKTAGVGVVGGVGGAASQGVGQTQGRARTPPPPSKRGRWEG